MDDLENLDPNQIKQLIGMLQKMLPNKEDIAKKNTKKKNKPKSSLKTVSRSKRVIDQKRENKFVDMPEMSMHKSDTLIDKQLQKFPPTPRSRGFSLVNVVCRTCGKKEQVSPKLVPESIDRYKCNNCSSTQG